MRGGGGNFRVVFGIDYALHPVGPEVIGGVVAWPISEAAAVLALYRTLAEQAPPELTLVTLMHPPPPGCRRNGTACLWWPAWPACYTGNPAESEKLVAPIMAFGQPIGDVRSAAPMRRCRAFWTPPSRRGASYYWKSEYLPRIEPGLREKAIAHAARVTSPHGAVIFFQLGEVIGRRAADHSAVGNRDARYVVNLAGSWGNATDDTA